jgi:hypothetical protein
MNFKSFGLVAIAATGLSLSVAVSASSKLGILPAGTSVSSASVSSTTAPPTAIADRPLQRAPVALSSAYNREQIDYFLEIALGSEFGNATPKIRKWAGPISIRVAGTPTAADWQTLNGAIAELNALTEGIDLYLDADDPHPKIEMYFVPESEFNTYEPNYIPRNYGFFWTWWERDRIYRGRILIASAGITQQERSHLIREELTQSLGLMRDSSRYRDSIFFEGWTDTTAYSPLDKAVISLLYRHEIRPGMTRDRLLDLLDPH